MFCARNVRLMMPTPSPTAASSEETKSSSRSKANSEKVTLSVLEGGKVVCRIEIWADQTLQHLASLLCEEIVREKREAWSFQWNVGDHMWGFEVGSASGPRGREIVRWRRRTYTSYADQMTGQMAAKRTWLSSLGLSAASRLRFTYDLGRSTIVALRVESVGEAAEDGDAVNLPRAVPLFEVSGPDDEPGPSDARPAAPEKLACVGDAAVLRAADGEVVRAARRREGVTALGFVGESALLVGLADGHLERWALTSADGVPARSWRTLAHWYAADELSGAAGAEPEPIAVQGLGTVGGAEAGRPAYAYSWAREGTVKLWSVGEGTLHRALDSAAALSLETWQGGPSVNCVALLPGPEGAEAPAARPAEGLPKLLAGLHMPGAPAVEGGDGDDDDSGGIRPIDGNIMCFDLVDGSATTWKGHRVPVVALAVVPGRLVASVGSCHVAEDLLLWDGSGVLLRKLAVWHDLSRPVSFDPDALAAGIFRETYRLLGCEWNASRPHVRRVHGAAIFGTTLCLLTDGGKSLVLYDLETQAAVGRLRPGLRPARPDEDGGFAGALASSGSVFVAANRELLAEKAGASAGGGQTVLLFDLAALPASAYLLAPASSGEGAIDDESDGSDESDARYDGVGFGGGGWSVRQQDAARGYLALPKVPTPTASRTAGGS